MRTLGQLVIVLIILTPTFASDYRWMQIPYDGKQYDIYLTPSNVGSLIPENFPLDQSTLTKVDSVYIEDPSNGVRVETDLAKRI